MKGSLMLSLESTNSKMSRNGKNELLLGKHKTMDEIIAELNAVSLESVNGLSRRLFTDDYALSLISPTYNIPSLVLSCKAVCLYTGQAFFCSGSYSTRGGYHEAQ